MLRWYSNRCAKINGGSERQIYLSQAPKMRLCMKRVWLCSHNLPTLSSNWDFSKLYFVPRLFITIEIRIPDSKTRCTFRCVKSWNTLIFYSNRLVASTSKTKTARVNTRKTEKQSEGLNLEAKSRSLYLLEKDRKISGCLSVGTRLECCCSQPVSPSMGGSPRTLDTISMILPCFLQHPIVLR